LKKEKPMSRLHKAARATAVVQAFDVAARFLSLVTVPLYLKWLGQERYGVLLTGLSFGGYLTFSDAGLSWSSMLLIAQASGRNDRKTISRIFRNSFPLAGCCVLLVALITTISASLITGTKHFTWLFEDPETVGLLIAVASSVACTLFLSPFYNLFIGMQEAHLAALYQGIGRVVGTVASVAVSATGASLGLVFGSNVLCALGAGLVAAFACANRYPWAFERGSFWDTSLVKQQLRTGAKSFAVQVGGVIRNTAPVLAISSVAGPQFVPYLSIPLTLLNAPLGGVNSFSASLQPGYGEAMGNNETAWVATTSQRILRQVLLMVGLLASGFWLLAGPFVRYWTGGLIELQPAVLGSALAIAVAGTVLGVFRFALTGINRHRTAGGSELAFGCLSMVLAVVAVRQFGFEWVGAGVLFAALLTSAWILPRELCRAVGKPGPWPSLNFLLRWAASVFIAGGTGWIALRIAGILPNWLALGVTGIVVCVVYVAVVRAFLPGEWNSIVLLLKRFVPKWVGGFFRSDGRSHCIAPQTPEGR